MHSQSKKNIWTAPPLPRTMWVSNMHFLSSRYFRQKSWTQGMSFCMAADGYSDGCAIDLTRLRLLACWTAPWHQPHASNTTRVPPVDNPCGCTKSKILLTSHKQNSNCECENLSISSADLISAAINFLFCLTVGWMPASRS